MNEIQVYFKEMGLFFLFVCFNVSKWFVYFPRDFWRQEEDFLANFGPHSFLLGQATWSSLFPDTRNRSGVTFVTRVACALFLGWNNSSCRNVGACGAGVGDSSCEQAAETLPVASSSATQQPGLGWGSWFVPVHWIWDSKSTDELGKDYVGTSYSVASVIKVQCWQYTSVAVPLNSL